MPPPDPQDAGKTGTVYMLVDPRYDVVRYIGQTRRSLPTRLSGHTKGGKSSPELRAWIADLTDAGLRPAIRALRTVPVADLIDAERAAIEEYTRQGWPLLNVMAVPQVDPVELAAARLDRSRRLPISERETAREAYRAARDEELERTAGEGAWAVLAAVAREVVGGPLPPPRIPKPPFKVRRLAFDYLASPQTRERVADAVDRSLSLQSLYESLRDNGIDGFVGMGYRDFSDAVYRPGWKNPADIIRIAHLTEWLQMHVAPWHVLALRAGLPANGPEFASWISADPHVRSALDLVERTPCRGGVYNILMDGLGRSRYEPDPCAELLVTTAAAHAPADMVPVVVEAGRAAGLVDVLYERARLGTLDEPSRDLLLQLDPHAVAFPSYSRIDQGIVERAEAIMRADGFAPGTIKRAIKALHTAVGDDDGTHRGKAMLALMLGAGEIPARPSGEGRYFEPLQGRRTAIAAALKANRIAA